MRIVVISDIHGNIETINTLKRILDNFPANIGCILVAGDIAMDFEGITDTMFRNYHRTNELVAVQQRSAVEISTKLSSLGIPVLLVPGNQDHPETHHLFSSGSVHNVDRKVQQIGEFSVVGFGGCGHSSTAETPYEWDEELAEVVIDSLLSNCPSKSTIVLSHTPPFGSILDLALGDLHVGSGAVTKLLKKFQPLICVCGHVHESPGVAALSQTVVVNPGSYEVSGLGQSISEHNDFIFAVLSLRPGLVEQIELIAVQGHSQESLLKWTNEQSVGYSQLQNW